jgi:hypothetical protein
MSKMHETRKGDCLSSIAEANHFRSWRTVYTAPENEALRLSRPNPNTLLPRDLVSIPDFADREEQCATALRHTFVARISQTRLRLRIRTFEPVWIELTIEGALTVAQQIEVEASIEAAIPPSTQVGLLSVWIGSEPTTSSRPPDTTFELSIGALPTALSTEGAASRLVNLGYAHATDANGLVSHASIAAYQEAVGLPPTGTIDDLTTQRLELDHDR